MSRAYLLGALHDGTVRKRTIRICQREERYVLLSSAWCSRWEPVPGRIARGRLAIFLSWNSRDLCLKVPLFSVAQTKSITREAISTLRGVSLRDQLPIRTCISYRRTERTWINCAVSFPSFTSNAAECTTRAVESLRSTGGSM